MILAKDKNKHKSGQVARSGLVLIMQGLNPASPFSCCAPREIFQERFLLVYQEEYVRDPVDYAGR